MSRRKDVKVIDRKIALLQAKIAKTKARYDRQCNEELQRADDLSWALASSLCN